jgi:hypothetical protein
MNLTLISSATLEVIPLMLWYSSHVRGFVAGDERVACVLLPEEFRTPTSLISSRKYDPEFPCVLPLPQELQAEFAEMPWHGLHFLSAAEYDHAVDDKGRRTGDLLRTLHYGPDYGLYVRHRASGLILSLKSGSLNLLRQSESGFEQIDSARTKGRKALCFAGHPSAPQLAYGDNYGLFHLHEFSEDGFGRAVKVVDKERKASRVQFIDGGTEMLLGGMGYLSRYRSFGKKWELQAEVGVAVRDFCWLPSQKWIFVNHGIHGLSLYVVDESGLKSVGTFKTEAPIDKIAVSPSGELVAVALQQSGQIDLIAVR